MKQFTALAVTAVLSLCLAGCTPPEQDARNAGYALKGYVENVQSQCATDPGKQICTTLAGAQTAKKELAVAIASYCGWDINHLPDATTKCIANKSLQSQLISATANANQFVQNAKGAK